MTESEYMGYAIIGACAIGGVFAVYYQWLRRCGRFGFPPKGVVTKTLLWFMLWSFGYLAIGSISVTALAVTVISAYFVMQLFALSKGMQSWGISQQAADSLFASLLITAPSILAMYALK